MAGSVGFKGGGSGGGSTAVSNFPSDYPDAAQQGYQANRYGGGKSAYAGTVSASGDTDVITPAGGNAIRVFWVYALGDPDNATSPLITVSIGATSIYAGYALAHWEIFEGAADEPVTVNLGSAETVAVTIHYEEFTP